MRQLRLVLGLRTWPGRLDSGRLIPVYEDDAIESRYYTVHACTGCGSEVHGLHGRWTCSACGECSPYVEPPEGWQADAGFREKPKPGKKPNYRP